MEYVRGVSIFVEIDTNKSDKTLEFDNFFDAARDFLERLSDQERVELFGEYCKYCGSEDSGCQCWNDE